jgi:hypothetical protein
VKPSTIVERIEVPIIREEIVEIERVVPYVQTEIREVKLIEEKMVLNNIEVEKIVPIECLI